MFDSPRDAIVFDTGHQSYVHKLLTGRQDFSMLRQKGGMAEDSLQRSESEHDIVESSHASSSLSWAESHGGSSRRPPTPPVRPSRSDEPRSASLISQLAEFHRYEGL